MGPGSETRWPRRRRRDRRQAFPPVSGVVMAVLMVLATGWVPRPVEGQVDAQFYDTLGVSRNVSILGLRKAFKKLALKMHPEKHKGDAA